jgi:phage terminase small subunit
MPRKSRAERAISPLVDRRATRLPPPDDLDDAAAAVWRRIVASCAPKHFTAADVELMRCYCESAVLSQESYAQMRDHGPVVDGRPSPWLALQDKAVRALAMLAPKLRLGPSARTDAKVTARQQRSGLPPSIYDTLGLTEVDHG